MFVSFSVGRLWVCLVCVSFVVWGSKSSLAADVEQGCRALFQAQSYLQAASCLEGLLRRQPLRTRPQQHQAGLWVQGALYSLQKAYQREKDTAKRAWMAERAVALCDLYLRKKMAPLPSARTKLLSLRRKWRRFIGYASLSLKPPSAPSGTAPRVVLKGYRSERQRPLQGELRFRLRPGTYQLTVHWSAQKHTEQTLVLAPGQVRVLRLTRPKERKFVIIRVPERRLPTKPTKPKPPPPPVGGWILTLGGGLMIAVGAFLVPYSILFTQAERDRWRQEATKGCGASCTRLSGESDAAGWAQYLSGWVLLGVGAGALVPGFIWLVRSRAQRPTRAKPSQRRALPTGGRSHQPSHL